MTVTNLRGRAIMSAISGAIGGAIGGTIGGHRARASERPILAAVTSGRYAAVTHRIGRVTPTTARAAARITSTRESL